MTPLRPAHRVLPRHRLPGRLAGVAAPLLLALSAAACGSGSHHAGRSPDATKPVGSPTSAAGSVASRSGPGPALRLVATTASWTLPAPVSRPVVVSSGSDFVILGGLATGDVSTRRIVTVDPGAGTAQTAGDLVEAVHDSAGAQIGGRFLTFGGGSYQTLAAIQAWTPAGGATQAGALPAPRSDLAALTVGTTTYVVGGFDGSTMDTDILATTDGTTFQVAGHLAVGVRYAAVAALDGQVWIFGGVTGTAEGSTAETDAIQRFDPSTGQVTVAGHLPTAMGHAAATNLGGQVFLIGGRSGTVPSASILRLDPATASMSPAGTLPDAQSDFGLVAIGDTAYAVGGETTGPAAPLDRVIVLHTAPNG